MNAATLERALALARGDIAPPAPAADLTKAGGGWAAIPGGRKGGQRRRTAKGWEYRYPDETARNMGVRHHQVEAGEHRREAAAHRERAAAYGDHAGGYDAAAHIETAEQHEANAAEHDEHAAASKTAVLIDSGRADPAPGAPWGGGDGPVFAHKNTWTDERRMLGPTGEYKIHDGNGGGFYAGFVKQGSGMGLGTPIGADGSNTFERHETVAAARLAIQKHARKESAQLKARKSLTPHPEEAPMSTRLSKAEVGLRIFRGELTPDAGRALLAPVEAIVAPLTDADLAKGDPSKPPSGYSPIPGGAHGGYRKHGAKGWAYWYPDTASASAAAAHHAGESQAAHKKMSAADRTIAGPIHHGTGASYGGARGEAYHRAVSERGAAKKDRDEHADIAAGSQKFVDKQSATRRILDDHADKKKREAAAANLPDTAPVKLPAGHPHAGRVLEHVADGKGAKGDMTELRFHDEAPDEDAPKKGESMMIASSQVAKQHYIAHSGTKGGSIRHPVETIAQHGLYAVHGEATKDSLSRNGTSNSKHSYTITHTPTGLNTGSQPTKAKAIAHAKHFHEVAGDAGKDSAFGAAPEGAAMAKLRAAYESHHAAVAKKAMDDWSPTMTPPDALLVKGFTGLASPDRSAVRPDAFASVKPAALRSGGGDVMLKGIGAGFDARWNDGAGFGTGE